MPSVRKTQIEKALHWLATRSSDANSVEVTGEEVSAYIAGLRDAGASSVTCDAVGEALDSALVTSGE